MEEQEREMRAMREQMRKMQMKRSETEKEPKETKVGILRFRFLMTNVKVTVTVFFKFPQVMGRVRFSFIVAIALCEHRNASALWNFY